jgi:hypothetical protein
MTLLRGTAARCSVPDIQLADNTLCDVILQTRVANHEHAGNSQDLFTKQFVLYEDRKNITPKLKLKL